MVSMCSEKLVCLPPCLSEVSPTMPLKWCLFNGVTNYGSLFDGVTNYGSLFGGVTNYDSHFNGVTNYGRVWRKGARERGLECGKIQANLRMSGVCGGVW